VAVRQRRRVDSEKMDLDLAMKGHEKLKKSDYQIMSPGTGCRASEWNV
jgi:hypothetical protein